MYNKQALSIAQKKMLEGYEIVQTIGKGTFGDVFSIRELKTGQTFALKQVVQNKKFKNRQLQIIQSVQSPYIIKLISHFFVQQKNQIYLNLIMEYIPQTLSSHLRTKLCQKSHISNDSLIKLAKCLLIGMKDMHALDICHRDVKPSNILIQGDTAKYCDFGSAKILVTGQKNISYICSRFYRAPQLLLGAEFYTIKVDIWSLGCVLAEMITNHYLFDGKDNNSMLVKIIRSIGSPTEEDLKSMKVENEELLLGQIKGEGVGLKLMKYNSECPGQLIRLVECMIQYNPQKRIAASQALQWQIFN